MSETREAILEAAETVVATKGVANLTFEEVAREAGISKGGVSIISARRMR